MKRRRISRIPEGEKEILEKMDGQMDKLDFLLQSMVTMSRWRQELSRSESSRQQFLRPWPKPWELVVPRAEAEKIQIRVDCDENLAVSHDRKWTG